MVTSVEGVRFLRALSAAELAELDDYLLAPAGHMRLMPAREVLAVGIERLTAWCGLRARYVVPTAELVDWLRNRIGGRSAIEIGAGQGDLGVHLGIPQTDWGWQEAVFRGTLMELMGQVPTRPPPAVERIGAAEAVRRYAPEVVIGGWITERREPGPGVPDIGLPELLAGYGVDEVRSSRRPTTSTWATRGRRRSTLESGPSR